MEKKIKLKVLLAEDDQDVIDVTRTVLDQNGYVTVVEPSGSKVLEAITREMPNLIILDLILPGASSDEIFKNIKEDPSLQNIPVIILTGKQDLESKITLLDAGADDFITKPFHLGELIARVNNIVRRHYANLDASPLTYLPGNKSITRKIEDLIDNHLEFAVSYIDLDNFKAFNDKYSFNRGDEILRKTGQILIEASREKGAPGDFIGHIGGDDFILISKPASIDGVCLKIIEKFDKVIKSFYAPEDVEAEGIIVEDRNKVVTKFPIMSISIGSVTNENIKLEHVGQISNLAGELKKYAKSFNGSTYVKDRRKPDRRKAYEEIGDKIDIMNNILSNKLISSYLQPIMEVKTNDIYGHESFCRGPSGSDLEFPDELFRIARITNNAYTLDQLCLEKSLRIAGKLKKHVKLFVNIAPETWLKPKESGSELLSTSLATNNINLEVSIGDILANYNHYKKAADYFRSKGFGIGIDDFGKVDINVLGLIKELKPDFVKLDFSLIRDIKNNKIKQNTLSLICDISKTIGFDLIAEQIETDEEMQLLLKSGIKFAQGYLFSKPEVYSS